MVFYWILVCWKLPQRSQRPACSPPPELTCSLLLNCPKGSFLTLWSTNFSRIYSVLIILSQISWVLSTFQSSFSAKNFLELYHRIFIAIIFIYFSCYVYMVSLCHLLWALKLKKKTFSFYYSHFRHFYPLFVFQQSLFSFGLFSLWLSFLWYNFPELWQLVVHFLLLSCCYFHEFLYFSVL